jgi:hypothetical protein
MRVIATALSLAVLAACSKTPQPTAASSNDDPALVKAGQFQIHQSELDYQAGRILSQNANANWDDDAEKALLDSLALTAAMASEQQALMSESELRELDAAVKLHRLELLAKRYMLEQMPKRQPTRAEVEAYYEKHKASLGEPASYQVTQYQLQPGCAELGELAKQHQLEGDALVQLSRHSCVTSRKQQRQEVAAIAAKLPADPQMQVGYWVQTQQGVSVWVLDQFRASSIPPLSDVAADIRQRLAPMYLKQSLQQVRETLNKDIEYLD